MTPEPTKLTDFGFKKVLLHEKAKKVKAVFDSVASKYDLMNDLMSLGLHRLWKRIAVEFSGVRAGQWVLDVASGTGDLARHYVKIVGPQGGVVMLDINANMLTEGRDRLMDECALHHLYCIQGNAEQLPFTDHLFDCVSIAFGLRNVTDKLAALQSMYRVLKPGGRLLVLEFSEVTVPGLKKLYDLFSFNVLPHLGKWVANDENSYRYLAESIRMHPNQKKLSELMETAGFENVDYHNLNGGIVAIHRGYKF